MSKNIKFNKISKGFFSSTAVEHGTQTIPSSFFNPVSQKTHQKFDLKHINANNTKVTVNQVPQKIYKKTFDVDDNLKHINANNMKATVNQVPQKIYKKTFDIDDNLKHINDWLKLKAKFKYEYSDSIDTVCRVYEAQGTEVEVNTQAPWHIDITTDDNEILGEIENYIANN